MDAQLIYLSQKSDSSKIRHNCARVLKNLTADSTEAIEEGAVAALIAISLEVCMFVTWTNYIVANIE